MKLSVDFGHWTAGKAAMAVAGVLVIAGAVGSALAIGPTVPAPVKWQGGWEVVVQQFTGHGPAYTVPAGRNLLVTDLVVANDGTGAAEFILYNAASGSCIAASIVRIYGIRTPAGETTVVPLTTGVGFASGQMVCVEVIGGPMHINMRGFLFTPAPIS